MYDVIIIGAGPAGMTAGIYSARKKLKTLILSKDVGGQMVWSSDVENYAGFAMITGADLTVKFREHLRSLGEDLELKEGVEVVGLEKNITSFVVTDRRGTLYYGRSVVIATGKRSRRLGIEGEEKFFGRGVAVCAICDAPLYKNKDVAVVGGGDGALDALLTLSKVARRIYGVNINPEFAGDEVLKSKVLGQPNISFYYQAESLAVEGGKLVSGLKIRRKGKEELLPVSGVFVEIGWEPNIEFDQLTAKNSQGEIKVGKNLQTNIPGLFAAGDVNDAWGEQIIIAAGEGAKAALAASDYLNALK